MFHRVVKMIRDYGFCNWDVILLPIRLLYPGLWSHISTLQTSGPRVGVLWGGVLGLRLSAFVVERIYVYHRAPWSLYGASLYVPMYVHTYIYAVRTMEHLDV